MLVMEIIERRFSSVVRTSCLEEAALSLSESRPSSRIVACCFGVAVGVAVERSGIL